MESIISSGETTLEEIMDKLRFNMQRVEKLYEKAGELIKSMENCIKDFSEVPENTQNSDNDNSDCGAESSENPATNRKLRLALNDRVVWLINEQTELGTVKWIGMMSDGLVAGVEFDEPIGNSDGRLEDGTELFKCENRHGRFVLIRELILWKDFSAS